MSIENTQRIAERLADYFPADVIEARPGKAAGNRALALFYVDARAVMDRLDEVLGVLGWQDEYEPLPDGCVVCRLRLRVEGEWITKVDVGSPSEQPDEGDRRKAAFSDALKRAAVKFGIGRYLYSLPQIWADFDPQKKRFIKAPLPPAGFLPKEKPAPQQPAATPKSQPAAQQKTKPKGGKGKLPEPTNGAELAVWLPWMDGEVADRGLAPAGQTLAWVNGRMTLFDKKLADTALEDWPQAQVKVAVQITKERWHELKAQKDGRKSALSQPTRDRLEALIQECRLEGWERASLLESCKVLCVADLTEQQAKHLIEKLEDREPAEMKE